jgi:hypothetical protein
MQTCYGEKFNKHLYATFTRQRDSDKMSQRNGYQLNDISEQNVEDKSSLRK